MKKSSPSAVGVRASRAGHRTLGVSVLVVLLAAVATACQPGILVATIGNGSSGNTGDGLLGTSAQMVTPGAFAPIPGGGYYVADFGVCSIRKIGANGRMSTVAGKGTCYPSPDDGSLPFGPNSDGSGIMALDASGNLYVADYSNNRIHRISPDGTSTTIPGPGGGHQVDGVAISATGSIFVNAGGNNIYELLPDGSYQSRFSYSASDVITSLKTGADGNLYDSVVHLVYDSVTGAMTSTSTVERLNPETGSTTVVASAGTGLSAITDVAVAADGTVYAAFGSFSIRGSHYLVGRMTEDGVVVIAGNENPDPGNAAQGGVGTEASISPAGIAIAPNGTLLISSGHVVYQLQAPASAGTGEPLTSLAGS